MVNVNKIFLLFVPFIPKILFCADQEGNSMTYSDIYRIHMAETFIEIQLRPFI
jgi:hypothetical protein